MMELRVDCIYHTQGLKVHLYLPTYLPTPNCVWASGGKTGAV
jgi:hypothetical protein